MDAPKRIWAVHHETLGAIMIGEWADSIRHLGGTEYILATEHDRLMAEKDAVIERLRSEASATRNAALEDAAKCCDDEADKCDDAVKWGGHPKYIANCKAAAYAMRDRAAAIRAMKDAPTDTPPSSSHP